MLRRRNSILLVVVLLIELLVLSWQVRRHRDISLLRQGTMLLVTPVEEGIRYVSDQTWGMWQSYLDLRGARVESRRLQSEIDAMKLNSQRLEDQASEGHRLQVLLNFKQQSPLETLAAQVISSGGSDNSRLWVLDKGEMAGVRPDMAVIVPDGAVGKVLRTFPFVSQVLLLTDSNSGVACLLESSRLHGILKGQSKSLTLLNYISNDEKVQIGERVFTSGEDQIYPKGVPVGVVVEVHPGAAFQEILVQPFAKMDRLEEVLVVTKKSDLELPANQVAGHTAASIGPPAPENAQRASAAKPAPFAIPSGKLAPAPGKSVTAPALAQPAVLPAKPAGNKPAGEENAPPATPDPNSSPAPGLPAAPGSP